MNATKETNNNTIYGRVSSINKESDILLTTDSESSPYIVLSKNKQLHDNHRTIHKKYNFEIGDIVRVTDEGKVHFLFKPSNNDNSLFLTSKCNQKCKICPQPPKDDKPLIYECLKVIRLLEPSPPSIGITGGEPTTAFEELLILLSELKKYHVTTWCQLLTNAVALAEADKAAKLAEIMGSQGSFGVPLYSDDEKTHNLIIGGYNNFYKAISGIYNLANNKSKIEIRCVITKQNYTRLPQYAEWLYYTFPFACHIAFMGYEPVGYGAINFKNHWINPAQYKEYLENAILSLSMKGMNVSIYNHPYCLLPKSIWDYACQTSISNWKQSYPKKCLECQMNTKCGGIFISALKHIEHNLNPVLCNE